MALSVSELQQVEVVELVLLDDHKARCIVTRGAVTQLLVVVCSIGLGGFSASSLESGKSGKGLVRFGCVAVPGIIGLLSMMRPALVRAIRVLCRRETDSLLYILSKELLSLL